MGKVYYKTTFRNFDKKKYRCDLKSNLKPKSIDRLKTYSSKILNINAITFVNRQICFAESANPVQLQC